MSNLEIVVTFLIFILFLHLMETFYNNYFIILGMLTFEVIIK